MTSQRFQWDFLWHDGRVALTPSVGSSERRERKKERKKGEGGWFFFEGFITLRSFLGLKHWTTKANKKVWDVGDNLKKERKRCLVWLLIGRKLSKIWILITQCNVNMVTMHRLPSRSAVVASQGGGTSVFEKRRQACISLPLFLLHISAKEPRVM